MLVPKKKVASQYPGLFIFTTASRMMRPVKNLAFKRIEYIGTFEQIYMNVAVVEDELNEGVMMHFFLM